MQAGIEAALAEQGAPDVVRGSRPVGGGCIHNGSVVTFDSGAHRFLKWSADTPPDMFAREADGLEALRATEEARVPEVIAWSAGASEPGWLLMEYVEPRPLDRACEVRLGASLARIHAGTRDGFGWPVDNWIGSLPQSNDPTASWADFWRDRRIAPQVALARRRHRLGPVFDAVIEACPAALADVTEGDLLHGDLWSGNVFADAEGSPVLIDPAVYVGHGEVDLAMTELFGGFGPAFYDAYSGVRPIGPEYRALRRPLYQLYYLLVHVNLFGRSYLAGATWAAEQVVGELA